MTVTIKDVAEKAGVSTATVSHVINETRFVAKETKQKVLQAMDDLDYHPNYAARSLRSKKSSNIGLIVPNFNKSTYTEITGIVEKKLSQNDYNIIFSNSSNQPQSERERLEIFKGRLVEGLIMIPSAKNNSYIIEILNKVSYPVVFLENKIESFNKDAVLVDNFNASYKAVNYLIDKGHKNIGLIKNNSSSSIISERLKGYKQALRDNGIEVNKSLIKKGDAESEPSYFLIKELLNKSSISALYVINNIMMLNIYKYIKEKNINIPEELAVLCFGDLNWSTVITPSLSVVRQPINKMASIAVEILLERINGKEFEKRELRLPSELKIRGSC